MSDRPTVLVVGAGVIGASIAYHLSLLDLEVTACGQGPAPAAPTASWASAGGLKFQRVEAAAAALTARSARRWPRLPDELGAEIGLRLWGSLDLATTEADLPRLRSQLESDRARGTAVELLEGRDFAAVGAPVGPEVSAGAFAPSGGQADPRATTAALLVAAGHVGARLLTDEVRSLTVAGERVVGVRTAATELRADAVVVAAGSWSSRVLGSAGVRLPLRSAGAHMLLSDPLPHRLYPTLSSIGRLLSIKQLPTGEVMIGGGWPATVEPDGLGCRVRPESVERNLANAEAVAPWTGDLELTRSWCGIDGETPDQLPLIGELAELPGLYLATGFSLGGFQLAPAVGELVAQEVAGSALSPELEGLRPGRELRPIAGSMAGFLGSQRETPQC